MRMIDRETMERASIKDLARYGIKVESLNLLSVSDRGEAKERMKDGGSEREEVYMQLVWEYLDLFTGIDEDVRQEVFAFIMEAGPTPYDFRHRVRRTVLMVMRNEQRKDFSLHMHEIAPLKEPDEDFTLNEVLSAEVTSIIRSLMDTDILTDMEKKVLIMRFGMDGGKDRTLQECADVMERSKDRIRQIEINALRKFRRPSTIRKFGLYPIGTPEPSNGRSTKTDIRRLSKMFNWNDIREMRRMFIEGTFKTERHNYWWISENDIRLITSNLAFKDINYRPELPMDQFIVESKSGYYRFEKEFKNLKKNDIFTLYYPNGEVYSDEGKHIFTAISDAYIDAESGEWTIDVLDDE